MRSHVQPGLVAGADHRRFVSKHWGWLRALLVLCLLFAVGATETEEIRFQTRQSKRPMRVRQWRHHHAGRRLARNLATETTAVEAADPHLVKATWLETSALEQHQPQSGDCCQAIALERPEFSLSFRGSVFPPGPPGIGIPPGVRIPPGRSPPRSSL